MMIRNFVIGVLASGACLSVGAGQCAHDSYLLNRIEQSIHVTPEQHELVVKACEQEACYQEPRVYHDGGIALYAAFPALQKKLPHMTLCALPTPIQKLEAFGAHLGLNNLYCKRDDLCGGIGRRCRRVGRRGLARHLPATFHQGGDDLG